MHILFLEPILMIWLKEMMYHHMTVKFYIQNRSHKTNY